MAHARKNSLWTPPVTQKPQLLAGKTMIITGGVTGIGRAVVLGYLEHGANVAVNHFGDDRSTAQFQSLIEEAATNLDISKEDVEKRLVQVPGDVGNPETGKKLVSAVVERWERLDVVVSNAGICEFKEFLECVIIQFSTSQRKKEKKRRANDNAE
jgi:L-rhamnose 1-dehydrogenase